MNTLPLIIVFFVGVMAFAGNLFYRVIILYVRHRDHEPINWWWEILVVLALPLTIMLAIVELMYILGWFSPTDKRLF